MIFKLSFVFIVLLSSVVRADESAPVATPVLRPKIAEIDAGSDSSVALLSGTRFSFGLGLGYHHLLPHELQAGVRMSFVSTKGGDTQFQCMLGPTLNFPITEGRIADAFYLRPLAGLGFLDTGSRSYLGLHYRIEVGKRFIFTENVTWKPAFRFSGSTENGGDGVFALIPLEFSFFF